MQSRSLVPELLDILPASDPRAIRARRDLFRVNAWMGNAKLMARLILNEAKEPICSMLDLGSGDGQFTLSVARLLAPTMPGVAVTLIDRRDIVCIQTRKDFETLGWSVRTVHEDVFHFLKASEEYDLVTANLFLHHFQKDEFEDLLTQISLKTKFLAACEPARTPLALTGSHMLWAIGCNDVTRNDAVVSVKAGFKGGEISEHWPSRPHEWALKESSAGLFSHLFTARRLV